jgi:glycosyltransferase involved in cell wall biosynthesis
VALLTSQIDGRRVPDPGVCFRLLLLANLAPRQGIGAAMRALDRLRAEGVQAELTLAGGGMVAHFRQLAHDLGVGAHCRFVGQVAHDRAQELFDDADALIVPSCHEGLPASIIAAFSVGLPVVTTPFGTIPETLRDGVECLFVPFGSDEAIAAAARRLIDEPDLGPRLAEAARHALPSRLSFAARVGRFTRAWQA